MCGVLRANYAIFGRLFASLEGRREIFSGLGHKKSFSILEKWKNVYGIS